jgi:hypothetical protein
LKDLQEEKDSKRDERRRRRGQLRGIVKESDSWVQRESDEIAAKESLGSTERIVI